jgi:hypothetical protein
VEVRPAGSCGWCNAIVSQSLIGIPGAFVHIYRPEACDYSGRERLGIRPALKFGLNYS